MEKDNEPKTKPVAYYGKKAYRIHPLLARVKSTVGKTPDFSQDNITTKEEPRSIDQVRNS